MHPAHRAGLTHGGVNDGHARAAVLPRLEVLWVCLPADVRIFLLEGPPHRYTREERDDVRVEIAPGCEKVSFERSYVRTVNVEDSPSSWIQRPTPVSRLTSSFFLLDALRASRTQALAEITPAARYGLMRLVVSASMRSLASLYLPRRLCFVGSTSFAPLGNGSTAPN